MIKVSGVKKALKELNKAAYDRKKATMRGLLKAGLILQADAQRRTPVDTRNLRGSAYTRKNGDAAVDVGYTAAYAVFVHEDLEAKHTNGEAKFLENAIKAKKAEMLAAIKNG